MHFRKCCTLSNTICLTLRVEFRVTGYLNWIHKSHALLTQSKGITLVTKTYLQSNKLSSLQNVALQVTLLVTNGFLQTSKMLCVYIHIHHFQYCYNSQPVFSTAHLHVHSFYLQQLLHLHGQFFFILKIYSD